MMFGEKTYQIIRVYQDERRTRVMRKNLSERQAIEHCSDPETSSMTARKPKGCDNDREMIDRWHEKKKHWFDGFTEQ